MAARSWRSVPLPGNWQSIRKRVMERDRVCLWGFFEWEDGPCGRPSEEVDHLFDPGDHSMESLRGICAAHHRIRTASQQAQGRARIAQELPRKRPERKHPGYN